MPAVKPSHKGQGIRFHAREWSRVVTIGDFLGDHRVKIIVYHGEIIVYQGEIVPYHGEIIVYQGEIVPYRGEIAPYHGEIAPYHGELIPSRSGGATAATRRASSARPTA